MRDYGTVHSTFWTSPTTHDLSDDARTLALYLLTGPHTTALGCFRLPDGYAVEDLRWSSERVSKAFTELSQKGFANRCETTKVVFISAYLKWNPPENPNQVKNLKKLAAQIPDSADVRSALVTALNQYCGPGEQLEIFPEKPNSNETLSKPFRNQEQEQEQEQEQIQEQKQKESCAERLDAQPPSPVVFRLPLIDKTFHEVREVEISKWSTQYPAVNVRIELGKMLGWLEGNPKNKKTCRGIMAFVHRWLAKAQDQAPRVNGNGSGTFSGQRQTASERMAQKLGGAKK